MDAYEKWFIEMEAKRKLEETEDAKKKLSDKTEGVLRPLVNMEDKEKPLEETEDEKKRFVKMETKKELSEKRKERKSPPLEYKTKLSHLAKLKSSKKPSDNAKPGKKPYDQIKAFKFTKDVSTVEIIPDIGAKEIQLRNHVLVVDYNLDDNSFKDETLIMIKKVGIDYMIAPRFTEEFYKKASDIGLHLIKCSDSKLIDEGNNIEVYLEEGVLFDVDNGQEYKFKLMTDSVRRSTVHKISLRECLLVGDNLKIKVLDIAKDQIKLCVNALKVETIYLHKSISIGDEIKIKVLKINLDQADLEIETPKDITINRA
jgi:sRNA-binding carbon storage regulator CsrA